MNILISVYLFFVGAIFGSFAGAIAWRLEKRRDIVRERSECEHCHHVLAWYDLIPLFSWLQLKGKCRYCRKPIGVSALVLESGLGSAFLLSYLFWSGSLTSTLEYGTLGLWLVSLVMLAILFIYDLRHYLLPDVVIWPLAVVGAMIFVSRAYESSWSVSLALSNLSFALVPVGGVYGLLYIISKGKWIGFGDVKLGLFIGLALGWQGALLVLLLANFIGCLWIIPSMLLGRITAKSRIPFGPFLIIATYIAFLWGDMIISSYMSLFIA